MRLLHIVTLVSPDAAFGGPVRVASNQAAALRQRGHDVRLVAAQRGYDGAPPEQLDGTELRSFRARTVVPGVGFSGLTAPAMLRWLPRAIKGADMVHVHLARDLITLPAAAMARRLGVPYVLQPHGMVAESGSPLAPALDAVLTRRVLRGARAVFHLTPEERASLLAVGGDDLPIEWLGNGVPDADVIPPLPDRPSVLYCARLQKRKRPLLFVSMARTLLDEGSAATFALAGPDEGEGPAVQAEIDAFADPERLRWEGALRPDQTLARMMQASIVVLPSVNEPYPMSVLEAMSIGRPVVITDTCGLAGAVAEHGAGIVVDSSPEALNQAVRSLLADPDELQAMSRRAAAAARDFFSMQSVTDRLETVYRHSA